MYRVTSVDVFRGLVLLLLIPDPSGAFSLHKLSEGWFASQVQHSEWGGITLWDLVMPAFVFLIGVSMPFSRAARLARGESESQILLHAVLRSVTLILLGLTVTITVRGIWDELWPFIILVAALPVPALVADRLRITGARRSVLEVSWWGGILVASAIRYFGTASNIGIFESAGLLVQVGLAFIPAFIVARSSLRIQALAAAVILFGWWLAFALYPLPSLTAGADQQFSGFLAHWNRNANFASAFDVWFFNLFPRTEPFELHAHGYQTLNFVPMTANMILGAMAGALMRSTSDKAWIRNRLALWGFVGMFAGVLFGATICPIVKSIWTPSYALFGTGCTAVTMALLYQVFDMRDARRWALPFVVLGANSILLYVLSIYYRWRIVSVWDWLGEWAGFTVPYSPFVESIWVLATLWLIGYVLYRMRIFVRV